MKKNIILTALLLISIASNAQRIELSNMASVVAPANMKKMEKNQILDFSKQKFSKRPDLQRTINGHPDNVYKIDNVLVEIHVNKSAPQPNRMIRLQGILRDLGPTTIEKIDDKQLLVTLDDDKKNSVMTYMFFCLNKLGNMQAAGIVQFEPSDQKKAKSILYDLIKNLKFKEQ